jgi:histidinol-phosphate/aromatic aminotransferase/cobyric acid decarboxylase-like protein
VQVGDAASACNALLGNGIGVRPCADLELPGWLRIAVPHPDDLDRVVSTLTATLRAFAPEAVGP